MRSRPFLAIAIGLLLIAAGLLGVLIWLWGQPIEAPAPDIDLVTVNITQVVTQIGVTQIAVTQVITLQCCCGVSGPTATPCPTITTKPTLTATRRVVYPTATQKPSKPEPTRTATRVRPTGDPITTALPLPSRTPTAVSTLPENTPTVVFPSATLVPPTATMSKEEYCRQNPTRPACLPKVP